MVRDAIRSLRAAPGVTVAVLFILTVAISVATVTFSVVDAVVLRPLPFEKADELVSIAHDRGERALAQARALSAVQFLALRDRATAFSSLAAVARGRETLQIGNERERVWSARVSSSLFEVLRVRPQLGQMFTGAHEVSGSDRVAMISDSLWWRRFGGDPNIVGRLIEVEEGSPLTVLGVMPRGFSYPIFDDRLPDLWTPYVIPESELGRSQSSYLHLVGRLRSGSSLTQAQAQADTVRTALAAGDDRYSPAGRFVLTSLADAVIGPVRGWFVLVLIAVGLLLLIACANVANLLLTRALDRARELSIRAALGATKSRLASSLLIESLILSLGAVILGLFVASWGIAVARAALPPGIARAQSIALDVRVFATAVGTAVITGVLFGLVPVFQTSRSDLVTTLKQGGGIINSGRSALRQSVLVAEIAFASLLLVATTLFVSSFIRLVRADLGFDRSDLLVITDHDGLAGPLDDFVARLESLPGIESVGGAAAGSPPLIAAGFQGGSSATGLRTADMPAAASSVMVEFNRVTPGYFSAARIPIVRGRVFQREDAQTSNLVVLDQLAAAQLFHDREPLGREVLVFRDRATVVGVVANVRMGGPEAHSGPQAYFLGPSKAESYAYLVRTSRSAETVIPLLQSVMHSLRPAGSRPAQIRRVEDAFRNITARRRFSASTMAIFGLLALIIGAAGVYGVTASFVSQRTREIGVRMTLGATRSQIVRNVLGQVGGCVLIGLIVGLATAALAARSFDALFFHVSASDPWVYLAVSGLLATTGLAAAYVPSRRASLIDPLLALRSE